MKKLSSIFLILSLFFFTSFIVKAAIEDTTIVGLIDYGCPEEKYYSNTPGFLPSGNILYSSNVFQRDGEKECTITYVNEVKKTTCTSPTYDSWIFNKDCKENEYCDKDTNDNFYCHLASQCDPNNFSTFPTSPLIPRNNAVDTMNPVELNWCNLPNYSSYKINFYKLQYDVVQNTKVYKLKDTIVTNETNYCSGDLSGWLFNSEEYYKWEVAYCTGSDGTNCENFGNDWYFTTGDLRNVAPPKTIINPPSQGTVSPIVDLEWVVEQNGSQESYYVEIYNFGKIGKEEPVWTDVVMGGKTSSVNNIYLTPNTKYEWRIASCDNGDGTACGKKCCDSMIGIDCADFTYPAFKFETNSAITYDKNDVILISPFYAPAIAATTDTNAVAESIPLVTPNSKLEWKIIPGVASYRISIKKFISSGSFMLETVYALENNYNLKDLWDNGKVESNNLYSWKIDPCKRDSAECSNLYGDEWKFKTSGGITSALYPSNGESDIPSDFNFKWKVVPGAISYIYEIETPDGLVTGITPSDYFAFNYDERAISQNYKWKIKACAGSDGTYCPDSWQDNANFTIADFTAPTNPLPVNGGSLFTYENYISWDPVILAKAYQVRLQYSQKAVEETRAECVESSVVADNVIIESNRFGVKNKINCLGQYEWWVTSCFDEDCSGVTETSSLWKFNSIKSVGTESGIMPCNRKSDNINTSWDETESCNLKHVPIFLYNVLDFILWKASVIALVLLIIASGAYSYAAAGLPIKVVSLKTLWISAGKGYAVMFLAWAIISLALRLLGISEAWLILPF